MEVKAVWIEVGLKKKYFGVIAGSCGGLLNSGLNISYDDF
jgi:hypothetical protein